METTLSVLALHQAFQPHQFMIEKQITLRLAGAAATMRKGL